MICTICSVNLVYNQRTNEIYCPKCGLVYGTLYYSFYRKATEDHDFYRGYTEISLSNVEVDSNLLKLKKINKELRNTSYSKLRQKFLKLYSYANELGIQLDSKAIYYLKRLKESKVKTRYVYLFSIILYALERNMKIDEEKLKQTLKKHRLSKRKFNKLLRRILEEFKIEKDVDYTNPLQIYLNKNPSLNKYLDEIIDTIEKIKEISEKIPKTLTPKTIVSLAIYLLSKKYNFNVSYIISKTTLRNNYKLIEKYLKEENK